MTTKSLQQTLQIACQIVNLSKQHQRVIEGPLLLDFKLHIDNECKRLTARCFKCCVQWPRTNGQINSWHHSAKCDVSHRVRINCDGRCCNILHTAQTYHHNILTYLDLLWNPLKAVHSDSMKMFRRLWYSGLGSIPRNSQQLGYANFVYMCVWVYDSCLNACDDFFQHSIISPLSIPRQVSVVHALYQTGMVIDRVE